MKKIKPLIAVVVSNDLREKIETWQKRERRDSQSAFCSLLLEYAVFKLERAGSTVALISEMEQQNISKGDNLIASNAQSVVYDPPAEEPPHSELMGKIRRDAAELLNLQEAALESVTKAQTGSRGTDKHGRKHSSRSKGRSA